MRLRNVGILVAVLATALLAGLGTAAVQWVIAPDTLARNDELAAAGPLPRWVLDLLPLAAAFVVHELGHVAGTWLTGGRFHMLGLGPLLLKRTPTGLRIERNRYTLAFFVGAVSDERPLASYAAQVAGGPLANLLTFPVCLAAWLGLADVAPATAYAANMLGLYSVIMFAWNALPVSAAGTFSSDGARLLELWRAGSSARGLVGMVRIQALDLGGVPPADWPAADVDAATALVDARAESGWVARLCITMPALLARHAFDDAEVEAERLLANAGALPSSYVRVAHLQAAFLAGRRGDVVRARELLATAPRGLRPLATEACVEAAIHRAEGAPDQADAVARAYLATSRPEGTGQDRLWRALLAELSTSASQLADGPARRAPVT